MKKEYYFPEDYAELRFRISKIQDKIKELGREQAMVAAQSTENFGHDDAFQEGIDLDRRVEVGRLKDLLALLNSAQVFVPVGPFEIVRLGATVRLSDGRTLRIGSYRVYANYAVMTISYDSQLGRALLGKMEGDIVSLNGAQLTIEEVF